MEMKRVSNRTLKSCTLCRQRKVKCGKERPSCSNCLKKNKRCEYQHDANQKQTKETINAAKKKKLNHQNDPHENCIIDFYAHNYESPVHLSQGVFTWVSILKKDRFMNIVTLSHKLKSVLTEEKSSGSKANDSTPDEFIKKWNKSLGHMSVHRGVEKAIDLFEEIKKTLCNPKVIWSSIDLFFESEQYLFFPYVDKEDFIAKLIKLIGEPNYDDITIQNPMLRIKRSQDLSTIGILLIILRFVSFSYYNFGKSIIEHPSNQFLINNPTPPSVYFLITEIHKELCTIRTPSIQIFQFIGMKLCFEYFSPEEYDCLSIANCGKLGELYQYAMQCALNRDPDQENTSFLGKTKKEKNLSRRLWYMVVFSDLLRFSSVGYPPIIDKNFYDTKLPEIDENGTEFDYMMNQWIIDRMNFYTRTESLLKLILKLDNRPTVAKLQEALQPFIDFTNGLETLEDIMKLPCETLMLRYGNCKKLMALLQSNLILFTIYYHLFLFYCEKQNTEKSVSYLIEIIKVTKILYKPLLFMDHNVTDYNLSTQFGSPTLCFPKLEVGFHKVATLLLTILSRIKGLKIIRGFSIEHGILIVVDEMLDILKNAFAYTMTQYINASDVYYHTWVLSKVQVAIAFKILKVPSGPFLSTDFTEEDSNFKQSLEDTSPINSKGTKDQSDVSTDIGFENYSLDDLKRVLNELKGLKEIVDYGTHHPSRNYESINADNVNQRESRKKHFGRLTTEAISDNDKKWFDKMVNEFGQGSQLEKEQYFKQQKQSSVPPVQGVSSNIIADELLQNDLNELSNEYLSIENLNALINGSEMDNLFSMSLDSFLGIGQNDWCPT